MRTRPKGECVKCGNEGEFHAFQECIKCYNKRRRRIRKFEWSYEHEFCIICNTTKHKHHGKGYCVKCRNKHDLTYRKNKLLTERRPERLKAKRDYKKRKEVMERERERLRNWRKENPTRVLISQILSGKKTSISKKQVKEIKKVIKDEKNKM